MGDWSTGPKLKIQESIETLKSKNEQAIISYNYRFAEMKVAYANSNIQENATTTRLIESSLPQFTASKFFTTSR